MDVVPTTWCSLLSQGIVPTTWVMAPILVDHYKYNTKYNWSLLLTCCNGDRCSSRCCTRRAPRTCCSGGGTSGGWRMASPVPWSSSSSPRRRCSTSRSGGVGRWSTRWRRGDEAVLGQATATTTRIGAIDFVSQTILNVYYLAIPYSELTLPLAIFWVRPSLYRGILQKSSLRINSTWINKCIFG